jgi:hypothetical protein
MRNRSHFAIERPRRWKEPSMGAFQSIWPGFTTNAAGVGNGNATVGWTAGSTAVSVVVHAPGGAKIACADLE